MVWRCALLAGLVACGKIGFDAADGGAGPGGGDGSGSGSDGSGSGGVPGCIAPGDGYTFPGGLPCGSWGTPIANNAGMSESNGSLSVTPNANSAGAKGGCSRANVTFTAAGVFAEVQQTLDANAPTAETALQLQFAGTTVSMTATQGVLECTDGTNMSNLPYDPVAERWWRIRPAGTDLAFDVSPDGSHWTELSTSQAPPATTATVQLVAFTTNGEPSPGVAIFDGIDVCPP